ncbi:MAG: heavy-metal-associated domain-containing protein [Phycisphaerales bacterium]
MKTLTKSAVLASCLALASLAGCASSPSNNAASMGAISMPVKGMACENCANEIATELMEVPGVKSAKVNFKRSMATVELDPSKPATREQLEAAVDHWRKEHFGAKEDEKCLDPENRERIKEEAAKSGK